MNKQNPSEFVHAKVTLQFAKYLCSGSFEDAHAIFSTELQETMNVDQMKAKFIEMIRGYIPEEEKDNTPPFTLPPPSDFDLNIETTLEEYRNMRSNDVGWAYCSICGDNFSEAVAATVARETNEETLSSKLVIRDIEFGRP